MKTRIIIFALLLTVTANARDIVVSPGDSLEKARDAMPSTAMWSWPGPRDASGKPEPYPLLNPPKGITPALTRGWYPWSPPNGFPKRTWTLTERAAYENKVAWFHQAKYGISVCFLARSLTVGYDADKKNGPWDAAKWNKWVDAVDVEKFADQVKELGAGFVILTLNQTTPYNCAPNPVIDQEWGLRPGEFSARRDLPMDLAGALEKRGIRLMLYIESQNLDFLPLHGKVKTWADGYEAWIKAAQWWADHYGRHCSGWWVDDLHRDYVKDYRTRFIAALRHGNPDALIACASYELSDFVHGHCQPDWHRQYRLARPYFGQWDPDYGIQWQVFQYLGNSWGCPGTAIPTDQLVRYSADVVRGGGVITFDIGAWSLVDKQGFHNGPFLKIQPDQFAQIAAVRDAVKGIAVSDGSGGVATSEKERKTANEVKKEIK